MAANGSLKSIIYALVANFSIAVAKGVAAFITNSGAMFAEAIHSLSDCVNQLLLLWGLKRAKRPPSTVYPLGYGKEIYFWSFLVAILLFTMGGMFSLYEGVHKLQHPEQLNKPWIAAGVLIYGIIAEGLSLAGCIREVNRVRGDRSLWRWFRTSRRSALIVIFGEDLAAMLGLMLALVAVLLSMATGNPLFDALGTLCIGTLLLVIAVLIGREVKDLLVGQGVEAPLKAEMEQFVARQEGVGQVLNLVTLQLGDDVMVAVKAKMAPTDSSAALVKRINEIEAAFRQAFPQVLWLFFEPDNQD